MQQGQLSARQREIGGLVASGRTNREIGELLNLSDRTVETHIAALFNKLGVRSRTELVATILKPGFAQAPPEANKSNLPLELNRLVGRGSEVALIAGLLSSERLVTITGAGGIGKSRVALHVARLMLEVYPDGVWLVELAPLSEPELVVARIARTLGFTIPSKAEPLSVLAARLKRQNTLLVLDECEHLIDTTARVADALLAQCPGVRILATSREALKVAGERSYRLPSLRFPEDEAGGRLSAEEAAAYDAVALFAERASSAQPVFALSDDSAPPVVEICRRLDGIPLALELAAGRLDVMGLETLARSLDRRFAVLTGGLRTALPRQQTMRALIDWSYDLLSARERRAFERLSVFAGRFTLDMAVAVCSGEDETDAPSAIYSLVDKSLLAADLDTARYQMAESTRAYAREKLAGRGDENLALRKHALAQVELAERLHVKRDFESERAWLAQTLPEFANWRAALGWAFGEHGEPELGQRLAVAMLPLFALVAPTEGLRWVERGLALCDDGTPLELSARLERGRATLAVALVDPDLTLRAAQRCLELYRELGDEAGIGFAHLLVGQGLIIFDRIAESEAALDEALALGRRLGHTRLLARVLSALGNVRLRAGDRDGARAFYEEGLGFWHELGAEDAAARAAGNLAEIEFRSGNVRAALRLCKESLVFHRSLNAPLSIAIGLLNKAAYEIALDLYDDARATAQEGFELAYAAGGLDYHAVLSAQHLAAIAALQPRGDDLETVRTRLAARLLGCVDGRLAQLGVVREYTEEQEYDRAAEALSVELGSKAARGTDGGRIAHERGGDDADGAAFVLTPRYYMCEAGRAGVPSDQ